MDIKPKEVEHLIDLKDSSYIWQKQKVIRKWLP